MHTMIGLHCSASSGRQWDAYSQLLPAQSLAVLGKSC
jgi:hypothetical protein